jgi:LysR family glycine cleavage system transcriptional activator
MHIAANMLREGGKNAAAIAYAVGFSSEAAFNRAFKREFGNPPGAWKRLVEKSFAYDPHPTRLCISSTPTGANWLTRHITSFLDNNCDIAVELEPNPRFVDFERESLDCAIRAGRTVPTGVHVEHLFRTDFTPMCSPAFLAAHPDLKTPADLRNVRRITPNDPWWRAWWNAFDIEPPSVPPGAEMGAQVLDGLAAIGGQGVALLTPMFWAAEIAQGQLVRLFPEALDGEGDYWLVYPRARYGWPKIRRFSAWVHQLCERLNQAAQVATV